MQRYIEADRVCKDILSHSPEDIHSVLRIIENQPTADVVGEIIELLTELKDEYRKADDTREMWAIRYAISLIKKKYKENGK